MGQEITYCSKCQSQLRSADFEKCRAYRIDGVAYCTGCVPSAEAATLETKLDPPAAAPAGQSPGESSPPSTHRIKVSEPDSNSNVFMVIGVLVVLGIGLIAVLLPGGPSAAPREVQAPAPSVAAPDHEPRPAPAPVERAEPPVAPPVQKTEAARQSLQKARDFAKAHPTNWEGQRSLYDQAAWDARGTDLQETARAEREAVLKAQKEAFAAQAKALAETNRPRLEREEFGQALADWRVARGAHSDPEWTALVDRSLADIRGQAEVLLASLKSKGTPVKELRDRVTRWGLPELAATIADAPAPASPPPPVPAPEAEAVQKGWRAAMDLAAGRDYASAIKELDRARQDAPTPVLKAEFTADLEVMRALAAASDEAAKSLARLPKGQKISIGRSIESGRTQNLDGVIVRTEPTRLILKCGEEIVALPLGEIAGTSWAELVQARGGLRPAHLLCTIEGEIEGAKKYASESLPPKYAAFGAAAAQRAADAGSARREADARKLYAAADAEADGPKTAAGAAEKLASLLKDFGDTLFVRRNLAMIKSRMDAGKEFVFFPDQLSSGGTFRMTRTAKLESCWTSEADTSEANRKDNFVDVDFAPLPATEYRCWLYVGACCAETFEFFHQATDLAGSEPGAPVLAPVKHAISTSARKHSAHGGPKQPSRWGWVMLPLPKYSSPGAKRVRILTDQQGFSVAYAVVGSTRAAAPTEAELREWERARAAEPPRYPSDPSLVAYYNFDAGTGKTLPDLTRNGNHGVVKGAIWVQGRVGKALEFDGAAAHVKIPTSSSFDSCTKHITLAAWVFRKSARPSCAVVVGRQQGISWEDQWTMFFVNEGGGLCVGPQKAVKAPALPTQQWIHVASTFDGRTLQYYLNGAVFATQRLPAAGALTVEPKPVWIGAGGNDDSDTPSEFFHGIIDEVRVYNRVLPAAEISEIMRTGRP